MRIWIEDEHEARVFQARFRAVAYHLGPMVELSVRLPNGEVLQKPLGGLSPAAQCASLNERLEAKLQSRGSL